MELHINFTQYIDKCNGSQCKASVATGNGNSDALNIFYACFCWEKNIFCFRYLTELGNWIKNLQTERVLWDVPKY